MKVLMVEPAKRPYEKEIDGSLESLQQLVGGNIEAVYPFDDPVAIICNEENKLLDLPPNRLLKDKSGQPYDLIFGNFFLVGLEQENFVSLPDELIQKYTELFAHEWLKPARGSDAILVRHSSRPTQKYVVTDIAHPDYPWLHRIRAMVDIVNTVKAGDLGGFVETESNLSADPNDAAWIYDDAIVCGDALVEDGSVVKDAAIVSGSACVTKQSQISQSAYVTDAALIRHAVISGQATVLGTACVLNRNGQDEKPIITDRSIVYGQVIGNIRIGGDTVLFDNERVYNPSKDAWTITDGKRSVRIDPHRLALRPNSEREVPAKERAIKHKGQER